MIRQVLERLGIVEPQPPEEEEILEEAMAVNQEARAEIHESRNRRGILQLELELASRRHRKS